MKTEVSTCAEELTSARAQAMDDDDDDHDDHDDSDKIAEGLDPERLKAFNVWLPDLKLTYLHLSVTINKLSTLLFSHTHS